MLLLDQIIDEHFISSEKVEIMTLFNKYNVYNGLEKISLQLNILLQKAIELKERAPLSAITITSSNFLVSVNSQVIDIKDAEEKLKIQKAISKIGIRMLLSIIKEFPNEGWNIFEAVKESLLITSKTFDYDYEELCSMLNFNEIGYLLQTLSGEKYANELKQVEKNNPRILWTKKVPLDLLTFELKSKKWIRSQKEFSNLFNEKICIKIHWDMKYKYELALLLHSLVKEDFIRPRKGFFQIAEESIVDFSGRSLTKNSLKKISSKITNDQSRYIAVINNVEGVIKAISKF